MTVIVSVNDFTCIVPTGVKLNFSVRFTLKVTVVGTALPKRLLHSQTFYNSQEVLSDSNDTRHECQRSFILEVNCVFHDNPCFNFSYILKLGRLADIYGFINIQGFTVKYNIVIIEAL